MRAGVGLPLRKGRSGAAPHKKIGAGLATGADASNEKGLAFRLEPPAEAGEAVLLRAAL